MTTKHRTISYVGFLDQVQREAGLSRPEAERAVRATLQTLGDRLSRGQSWDLAAQLPPELAELVASDTKAQAFGLDEFVTRVAEREGVGVADAGEHVRAAFATLRRTVRREETG